MMGKAQWQMGFPGHIWKGLGIWTWVMGAEMQTYLLGFGSTVKTPYTVSILSFITMVESREPYFDLYILRSQLI